MVWVFCRVLTRKDKHFSAKLLPGSLLREQKQPSVLTELCFGAVREHLGALLLTVMYFGVVREHLGPLVLTGKTERPKMRKKYDYLKKKRS